MKRFACRVCVLTLLVILRSIDANSQGIDVVGPVGLCIGQCGTYLLQADSTVQIGWIQWSVNGAVFSNENPATYCPQAAGDYLLEVQAVIDGNYEYDTTLLIQVVHSLQPEIIGLSALCNDSLSACEKVCANTTATYQVTGVSPSDSLTWEVIGASSFQTNGTYLTVDWGSAGQGKIIVHADAGATAPPMQVFCGQKAIDNSYPGGPTGQGFVQVVDPPGTITITITGPGGSVYTFTGGGPQVFFQPSNLAPGHYEVVITDENGKVLDQCEFDIYIDDIGCWTTMFLVEWVHASACNACDGFLQIQPTGGGQLQYTVQWSNGATGYALQGLCPGTYTATITDAIGCTDVRSFQVWCPSTCSGSDELCVDVLAEPEAQIGSTPSSPTDTLEVCQGQTVFFKNLSKYASSYAWHFGDGSTSAQVSPSHLFDTPGVYEVSLIARNSCFCADTTRMWVNVVPATVPAITCTGTVCEGETVTYGTDATCSSYTWVVSGNGTVLDGGGPSDDYVTVLWNEGPEGLVSLGVSGCAGNVCSVPNEVPIPIVSDQAEIQGDDQVCPGSETTYSIPNYQGTSITWTVVGSGQIVSGQGSDRIAVSWYGDANQGNPQLVIVEFEYCYLGCGGSDTLEVHIVPPFYVEGPIRVCQDGDGTFSSLDALTGASMSSQWQLLDANGNVLWNGGAASPSATIPFNQPAGTYVVRATPAGPGFCNERYDVFVEVLPLPSIPLGVLGGKYICPGGTYQYSAFTNPAYEVVWTATSGSEVNVISGNPVVITWGASGPYSLEVAHVSVGGPQCYSGGFSFPLEQILDFEITGEAEVCLNSAVAYLTPEFEGNDHQWSISPASAGTILLGQGTEAILIQWNEPGTAVVSATICGITRTFSVNVHGQPEPEVNIPAACPGQPITVTTTQPYVNYSWKDEQGNPLSTDPSLVLNAPGSYAVEVTDANGCQGASSFTVEEAQQPSVSISTPSYYALCSGGPPAVIYASTQSGMSFQWYQDGNPVGTNSSTHSTTSPGIYWVEVTDANGCRATSNQLELVDCAAVGGTCMGGMCFGAIGGPPLPTCTPAGTVDFAPLITSACDSIVFDNLSTNYVPGSFHWSFDDPASGINNSSTEFEPSHVFTGPGYYTVVLIGEVNASGGGSCQIGTFKDLVIPAVADFTVSSACPMAPTHFMDNSQLVAGETITDWNWDFGDPASGAANFSSAQNPSHVYSASGNFDVTLTITLANGCQTSVTKTIEVKPLPSLGIDLPDETCESTPLPFSPIIPNNVVEVSWDFGDPASGAANFSSALVPFHSFGSPGDYTIKLVGTTIAGCVDSVSTTFTVTANTIAGSITANPVPPLCEGEQTVLSAPPGGQGWEWSNGQLGEQITVATSNVYSVTVYDAQGCSYSPPAFVVQINPEPSAVIEAVEYNEYGQPVAFHENDISVCEGDDLVLLASGQSSYFYNWSTGSVGSQLSFTSENGNLLPVGTHTFQVTITDRISGCTGVAGPFEVIVNPNPSVSISSVPSGFICENTTATLSVESPDPGLLYQWNTGQTTTSITVVAGGTYFVEATNGFGCSARSNSITLHNAPDPDLVPGGCHSRCQPDTMCLPPIPNVASYQWYLDGNPIPAPMGTTANPVFDSSGVYHVVMTDIYGCTSTSAPLDLDLQPGSGQVLGMVFNDVNLNGIIDAADTPLSGIPVHILTAGILVDSMGSAPGGTFLFGPIGAQSYYVAVDTANLPANWLPVIFEQNIDLVGCDALVEVNFLLQQNCSPSFGSLTLQACPGDSAYYLGNPIPAGQTDTFLLTNYLGCDSLVSVFVDPLPTSFGSLTLQACPGDSAYYLGNPIPAGQTDTFLLTNYLGCDSVVAVIVNAIGTDTTPVKLETCIGDSVLYEGVYLHPGDSATFTLISSQGCDSFVMVQVVELPHTVLFVDAAACENDSLTFNGQVIYPGQQVVFTSQNQFGCTDSTIVGVIPLPVDSTVVNLSACEGESVTYAGQSLPAGSTEYFSFTGQNGCDSVVQVVVAAIPHPTFDLEADSVCWNGTDARIEVTGTKGGSMPFNFSIDGNTWVDSPVFDGLQAGTYTVWVRNAEGCSFQQGITLPEIGPMEIEVEDVEVNCGQTVTLNPVVVSPVPFTFAWADGTPGIFRVVDKPGAYFFTVENSCETIADSVVVRLAKVGGEFARVYVPNVFSPNDDGINDCFRGYVDPNFEVLGYEMKIFDRWGDLIFETDEIDGCWDGTFRGKRMDPAVFVWFIRYTLRNCAGEVGEVFKEGGVQLMR